MLIELPYPNKILWPNGRGHYMKKHRIFQAHKQWAVHATLAMCPPCLTPIKWPERIRIAVTLYPKTAHRPDSDNAAASIKSYADGIAAALRVDDNRFDYAPIQIGEPVKNGKVVIIVGEGA